MAVMEGDWQGSSRVESLVWPFAAEEGSFRRRNRQSTQSLPLTMSMKCATLSMRLDIQV